MWGLVSVVPCPASVGVAFSLVVSCFLLDCFLVCLLDSSLITVLFVPLIVCPVLIPTCLALAAGEKVFWSFCFLLSFYIVSFAWHVNVVYLYMSIDG